MERRQIRGFTLLSEGEFDTENDLKELDRLLEESEFKYLTRNFEEQTRHVEETNTTCSHQNSRSDEAIDGNMTCFVNVHAVISDRHMQMELKTLSEHSEYFFWKRLNKIWLLLLLTLHQPKRKVS